MDKKHIKKQFDDAIDKVDESKEGKKVIELISELNNKLDDHDSKLQNTLDAIVQSSKLTTKGKAKGFIADILDNYNDYTSREKELINITLESIDRVVTGNVFNIFYK